MILFKILGMIKTVFSVNNLESKIRFPKKLNNSRKKMRMKLVDIKKILLKSQELKRIFIQTCLYI
jgi:transcriptional regulator of NAD metabolism